MKVRTALACSLLVAAIHTTGVIAQPASQSVTLRTQFEQRTPSRTVISPRMEREIRQSSVPAEGVITSRVDETMSLHDVASDLPQTLNVRTGDRSTAPTSDSVEKVDISMAALSERLNGIRDATVYQGDREMVLTGSTKSVELGKGDFLSVRRIDSQPVQVQANGGAQVASATLLYALDTEGVTRELALVHHSQGLTWDQVNRLFVGTLLVGIIDRDDPSTLATLPRPVSVQMLAAGNALNPTELSIDQIGGRFQKVDVALADPEDPYAIRLISPMDPDLPDAALPLRRLALVLMAPAQLDALGVGEGEVTVRARNGRLRSGESVTLYLDNGQLEEMTVIVGDDGTASTRVRSTGFGTGTLSLVAGPYVAEPVKIRYQPPILLLAATIMGAMFGASVFVYSLMRSSKGKRRFVVDWVVGCILGVGATAMVYAGMRLPEWIPVPKALVGAIVPFALAFVCAAMGAALIHFFTGFHVRSSAASAPSPQNT